eukprot:4942374-Pleurochrysis_carterae.AAC.3
MQPGLETVPAPAGSREIFLGGLPKSSCNLHQLHNGLHAALSRRCSSMHDITQVRLRLHTRAGGAGCGFGFAWLPDAITAAQLVQEGELYFDMNGERLRCGVRQARGHPDGRQAPTNEPDMLAMHVG